MKIGIITYHFVSNYGAAMQAWALQQLLEKLGHQAFIIDYRPKHLTTGGSFRWPSDTWSRRANLVIAYLKVKSLKNLLLGDGGKTEKFEAFHSRYLNLEGRVYRTVQELRDAPPDAEVYVCGSDQIWNASEQFGIDPSYFLDFAPPGVKRVSYAASLGRPYVHPRFEVDTAELISNLDAISVREKSTVDLVKSMCDREATWVPDPTLMVEGGYPEAIKPSRSTDYIFSYTLRSRELVAQIEENMSQASGLEVISPLTLGASGEGAPSPLEWLGFIKSSKYVITNSYHGTLFSIIFRKPFIFVGLSGAKAGFNERANSLLMRLGLQDRMMNSFDEERLESIMSKQIDWEMVALEIDGWREQANEYLLNAIGAC